MHVVGAQPPVPQLHGEDPGGLEEAGLAHRVADAVAAHVEWVDVGHRRGHVEHGPLSPCDHGGDEQRDEGQGSDNVNVDLLAQIGEGEIQHRGLGAPARVDGVVDQDIDVTPGLEYLADGQPDGKGIGQVHRNRQRVASLGPHRRHRVLDAAREGPYIAVVRHVEPVALPDRACGDDDIEAHLGQRDGDRPSHPPAGSSDECHPAVLCHVVPPAPTLLVPRAR
jgi:hypothetical protein